MATKTKKILFVHHAGGFGGAPKSMSYIIKNLDKTRFSAHLLNITEGPINDFFKELPCELIVPKKGIRPFHGSYVVESNLYHYLYGWFFLLPSVILAYRHLKRIKPSLIHLNSTCLFSFAIAARFLKIKTICHVREPIRKGWAGWPLRFFNKKFVSGFIAISEFDLDSLQLRKPIKRPHQVIYNFVENFDKTPIAVDSDFRKELKINEKGIVFLYLARFADSNGWKELVKTSKAIVSKNPSVHFVLVGAKNKEHFIETEHSNIHIVKFRSDIEKILKTTDIFVCPFTLPHFARGVIEAAAYAIPSIGSNIGGVNELIKNQVTGLLYKTEEEFIDCCQSLINNVDLRKTFGEQAYQFAKESFDPDKNLKRTYKFYENFIN